MAEPEGQNKLLDREILLSSLFGSVETSIEPPLEAQHRRQLELEKAQFQQKIELEGIQFNRWLGVTYKVVILVVIATCVIYLLRNGTVEEMKPMAKYVLCAIVGALVGNALKKT
jgi:type VI protein secretion system component VasF